MHEVEEEADFKGYWFCISDILSIIVCGMLCGLRTVSEIYASPYPYYFEGLILHVQGKNDEAEPCYTAALMNPAYPDSGVNFYYLKDMEVTELYPLIRVLPQFAVEVGILEIYDKSERIANH
jgi:hypothetical protein